MSATNLKQVVAKFLTALKQEIPMVVGLPKVETEKAQDVLQYLQTKLKESSNPDAPGLIKIV
jgi:hypothetical protein